MAVWPEGATTKLDRLSRPAHSSRRAPVAGSRLSRAMPPERDSSSHSSSGERQCRPRAEAGSPGVRLRAGPPPAGTSQTSPPFEPSSLIRPWITATPRPSGETRGAASCRLGFHSSVRSPLAASRR